MFSKQYTKKGKYLVTFMSSSMFAIICYVYKRAPTERRQEDNNTIGSGNGM